MVRMLLRASMLMIVVLAACEEKAEEGKATGSGTGTGTLADARGPEAPVPALGSATATGSGSVAVPDDTALKVGDRVMAKWTNGSWYPGKISAIQSDGTYDVKYDDGDRSKGLPASKVRKRAPKAASTGTGGTAGTKTNTASDAPCPGPGITRRCGGVCVNIQENNNHCGGCGNRCSDGKTCDGHLFCRDADGNL